MGCDPGALAGSHLRPIWIDSGETSHSGHIEGGLSRVRAVVLEDIASGDLWFGIFPGHETFDVHSIRIRLNSLDERVDTEVVGIRHIRAGSIAEDLDEPGARCIASDLATDFVNERIAKQGKIPLIACTENPIGFPGQAQRFDVAILVVPITPGFDRERVLGPVAGTGSTSSNSGPCREHGIFRQQGPACFRIRFKEEHGDGFPAR